MITRVRSPPSLRRRYLLSNDVPRGPEQRRPGYPEVGQQQAPRRADDDGQPEPGAPTQHSHRSRYLREPSGEHRSVKTNIIVNRSERVERML